MPSHLAAQPLIYESYKKPHLTFDINFNGSLNITDISINSKFIKSIVVVTSDKCYESNNSKVGFKEGDLLGGIDPYSSSKAVTEIMVRAYRKSFSKRLFAKYLSKFVFRNISFEKSFSKNILRKMCFEKHLTNHCF